jgi:predicted alpha/beta superfamily hydrolase
MLHNLSRSIILVGAMLGPIAAVSAPVANGTDAPTALPAARFALPETEEWDLASDDGSRTYRILVHRPPGPPPASGFSVLTVLDGNALFAGLVDTARLMRYESAGPKDLMVVAVGYPGDAAYDMRRRSFDLTPIPSAQSEGRLQGLALGGQREFLDFLLNRLRSELTRRYPVNEKKHSLYGHSFGGAFALYALYCRPDAFHAFVAASPSIWWNGRSLLKEEEGFMDRVSRNPGLPVQVSLRVLVGGHEPGPMVGDAKALASRMEVLEARGLRSSLRVLPEESHMSMPASVTTDVLRFVISAP